MTVEHDTIVHERELHHARHVVFGAWADAGSKRVWFDLSDDDDAEWSQDFRVGGVEAYRSAPPRTPAVSYDGRYSDIVDQERIVLTTEITVDGRRTSVALSSIEFTATDLGTLVTVTEQIAVLDGLEGRGDRRQGTHSQLERLSDWLDRSRR